MKIFRFPVVFYSNTDCFYFYFGETGPLAIAVDASFWYDYEGGVFDGCSYEENISLNHAVQVRPPSNYLIIKLPPDKNLNQY